MPEEITGADLERLDRDIYFARFDGIRSAREWESWLDRIQALSDWADMALAEIDELRQHQCNVEDCENVKEYQDLADELRAQIDTPPSERERELKEKIGKLERQVTELESSKFRALESLEASNKLVKELSVERDNLKEACTDIVRVREEARKLGEIADEANEARKQAEDVTIRMLNSLGVLYNPNNPRLSLDIALNYLERWRRVARLAAKLGAER
jgi:chromosome segregation ATPase